MMFRLLTCLQSKNLPLGIMFVFAVLLAGCAVVPQPMVEVYLEPIEMGTNAKIHPETGAVTVLQKGIAVTIEALDEVEIYQLTDDPRINPYIIVDSRGNVESIYTVFDLTVHNLESSRVLVEESAMLIDKNGAQYANLPYDYFEDLYDSVNLSDNNTRNQSTYPYYHTYFDVASLEEGQAVVAESLFESGKLFNGAKRRGLIIFERLNVDTTDMRITIPEIVTVNSDGKEEKLKFDFDFRQIVVEK